ncbi:hypothetical protein F4821DRAFT_236617 [Hypoxylon rubiginosum]|uniref:Uncharacterized protein n=1 Tax=Hypoxylon rubiginosum TaxID=110542 RepID=A0ACC0D3E4_9PEZI|nr:hypothetical protein F4821DRAFT_236617 [Hypoxylon rubiginosum]
MENPRADDGDNALASYNIPMFPYGDKENTFHVKNRSQEDWERRIVIERRTKTTEIRCHLLDVIHGTLDFDSNSSPATLMVFKFRFDVTGHARRLTRARIDIEFFAKEANDTAPTILAIAPDERWTILPTVDNEENIVHGALNGGVTGIPFVNAGAEVSLQKTWNKDISDATTVTGGAHMGENIDSGEPTACGWSILENKTRKTGLPDSLTVAVLAQRKTNKQFNATVSLEASGNIRTKLDRMFNKIPIDDPVLFNPEKAQAVLKAGGKDLCGEGEKVKERVEEDGPRVDGGRDVNNSKVKITPMAKRYSSSNLGLWKDKIHELSDVTFRTTYTGSAKEA